MALNLDELKFGGLIVTIAEDEMSASITDDPEGEFVKLLYNEYVKDGKPKNKQDWIRGTLKGYFRFVSKPPVWIEKTTVPKWPFFQGKPMVFIEQFSVPETDVSKTTLHPGAVIYVFGARKLIESVPGGW